MTKIENLSKSFAKFANFTAFSSVILLIASLFIEKYSSTLLLVSLGLSCATLLSGIVFHWRLYEVFASISNTVMLGADSVKISNNTSLGYFLFGNLLMGPALVGIVFMQWHWAIGVGVYLASRAFYAFYKRQSGLTLFRMNEILDPTHRIIVS